MAQVKSHRKSKSYSLKETARDGKTSQSVFALSQGKLKVTPWTVLAAVELVTKAEVLQSLKHFFSNHSFASAIDDSEQFKLMFPGFKIARSYKQGESKLRYSIQYGIAPYIKEQLLQDLRSSRFSFPFDESTTYEIKKQYDGNVRYWRLQHDKVVTAYCRCFFVGHCTNEQILQHLMFHLIGVRDFFFIWE